MAKRISKLETQLIAWGLIVGVPIYGISQLDKAIGWAPLFGGIIAIIGGVIWYKSAQTKKRREYLMTKYKDAALVKKLMEQTIWQGQTAGQLRDSLGNPEDIDEKVLKTKKKEVWKYHHQSANRYGLRITLDNDVVVGWDHKA